MQDIIKTNMSRSNVALFLLICLNQTYGGAVMAELILLFVIVGIGYILRLVITALRIYIKKNS